jgi:hypothetical protein
MTCGIYVTPGSLMFSHAARGQGAVGTGNSSMVPEL